MRDPKSELLQAACRIGAAADVLHRRAWDAPEPQHSDLLQLSSDLKLLVGEVMRQREQLQ